MTNQAYDLGGRKILHSSFFILSFFILSFFILPSPLSAIKRKASRLPA